MFDRFCVIFEKCEFLGKKIDFGNEILFYNKLYFVLMIFMSLLLMLRYEMFRVLKKYGC